MEPGSSLPHSQVHATCPYPQPDRSSPYPHIPLNTVLTSMPGSSKWPLSLRFPHQNPAYISPLPIRATCPAQIILLDLITRTILGEQYRSLSSSFCSFLHSSVTSSLPGPNNILNIKLSNILILRSSLSVSSQVSHTYTRGNIVFYNQPMHNYISYKQTLL